MSKNILFRGQTRKKGEKVTMSGTPIPSNWVFGGIFPQNNGGDFAIIYQQDPEIQKFPVYAETVCQYTGKNDKYGGKIFENDIITYVANMRSATDSLSISMKTARLTTASPEYMLPMTSGKETTKKASNGLFLRSRLTSLSSFSLMRNTKASSLRASTTVSMRRLRK